MKSELLLEPDSSVKATLVMAFAKRSAAGGRASRLVVSIRSVAIPLILGNAQSAEAERGYAFRFRCGVLHLRGAESLAAADSGRVWGRHAPLICDPGTHSQDTRRQA